MKGIKMPQASTRISFVTNIEKRLILEEIATNTDRKLSYVINKALDYYIELQQWQLNHINNGLNEANNDIFADDDEIKDFFITHGEN